MRAISPARTGHFAGADWIEYRCFRRRELKRVAVAARDQHPAAAAFFGRGGGAEKIIRLIAGPLGISETARSDEFWNERKLLDQVIVEFAAALVIGKGLVAVGSGFQGVPTDQHRARLLHAVELQETIGEAEDGAGGPAAVAQNVFWQRVIGAMSEESPSITRSGRRAPLTLVVAEFFVSTFEIITVFGFVLPKTGLRRPRGSAASNRSRLE
jgi:hypothetical protein